jgi:hypothetical protein
MVGVGYHRESVDAGTIRNRAKARSSLTREWSS